MPILLPKQQAREQIDAMLAVVGWVAEVVSQQVGPAGTKLHALAVPLPPLAEQKPIVTEVERRLSLVEELEEVVSGNLQRAARLRKSILQKSFSGQLTKREAPIRPRVQKPETAHRKI